MARVQCCNTMGFTGREVPYFGGSHSPDCKFDEVCERFQLRMRGPGCGRSGLVFFGAEAVGEIVLVDEPGFPRVAWTITIEER